MTLRVVELFAGIGAQAQALENLGIPFTSTVCEIDKFAYQSYCAIHGDTPNLGDIKEVKSIPECDLLTYSFPCQDLSIAGNRKGMEEGSGTRSSLLWEVGRLLDDCKDRGCLPEYLLMENVDAILNKKNLPEFNKWIAHLTDLGYTSSYKVLNARDFGIPQNRKRCFMVSTRDGKSFAFPEGHPLDCCLRDVLEEEVDEKFYLSKERIARYQSFHKQPRENETVKLAGVFPDVNVVQAKRVYDVDDVSPSITAGGGTGSIAKIEVAGRMGIHDYAMNDKVYGTEGLAPTVHGSRLNNVPRIEEPQIDVAGNLNYYQYGMANNTYDSQGISPTILATIGRSKASIPKIEVAGNLNQSKFKQADQVFSEDGISPCIQAKMGQCQNSMVKIEVAGSLNDPRRYESANRVYGAEGIAPTIPTGAGGGVIPKLEVRNIPLCVKNRKYDVDRQKLVSVLKEAKKASGLSNNQIAESLERPITEVEHWFRSDSYGSIPDADIWFALKSLLKLDSDEFDAPICEFITKEGSYEQSQRCYATNGVAPTLTVQGGVKVVEDPVQDSISWPCLKGLVDAHEGDGIVPSRPFSVRKSVQDGNSFAIAATATPGVVVRNNDYIPDLEEGEVCAMLTPGREKKRQNGRRCKKDGTAYTVTCQDIHGIAEKDNGELRVRYLTPLECWRLMGFPDEAYSKAKESGISKTQLYKQAGNSIVVSVLEEIFHKLLIEKDSGQPTLDNWTEPTDQKGDLS